MPLKFLILILCLSSVIADESSGEFPIEASEKSNTLTEYPEHHEDALLSPDLSENSTVQLLDLLKPIGSDDEGGLVEASGGTSGKSPDTATEIPKNENTAGAPENPRTTNLLDLFKMISGCLALLLIGCLLVVFIFYVGFWMRKMVRWTRRKIQDRLRNPQEAEMEMVSLDKFFPEFFVNVF
ncbi:hypothetical protein L3Y34_003208 [Caenorhabditis briggsae]|uniref:Uncharacterized protein n=1 Tax=Caenorhabditis briggsae TaxID=6238 RepID=A0AAE9A8J4_CAEBR|nr:hypothetical protein L3Y34_003208 [Caenorhabditis briggsae]